MNHSLTIHCISVFCTAVLIITGCGPEQVEEDKTSSGLWRQIGYGRILEINDSTIKVYDINQIDCMLTFEEHILDFGAIGEVSEDTLTLVHGIDRWKCVRLDSLPELCATETHQDLNDPVYNFDVFWQNFHEHYSSFGLKGVDWDYVRLQFRPKVSSETSDLELYLIFEEMIDMLEDGHVKMELPTSIEDEYQEAASEEPSQYQFPDMMRLNEGIARLYVDSLAGVNAGMTRWGMIDKKIGFVQINFMMMQADYVPDPALSLMEFVEEYWSIAGDRKDEIHRMDEASGMSSTLDRVLAELPQAEAMIIDLRFNVGGKDGVAMEIIRNFSCLEGEMASKYATENDLFVNHQNISNQPLSTCFGGPVYILTSHNTASASELAVLCSIADEQFVRIGSHTEGIFSSTLDKVLPNGWAYEFSNEIYEDINGLNYEHVGIPPDVEIHYPKDKDKFCEQIQLAIDMGLDPAIEAAISQFYKANF